MDNSREKMIAPRRSTRLQAQQQESTEELQPKPLPLTRPSVSLLEEPVNQQRPSSPAPKRYRPDAVHSSITEWVESGSYQGHYQPDSPSHHSDGGLISRGPEQLTLPDMDDYRSPPSSTGVRCPLYRSNNLLFNNIEVRHPLSQLPDFISDHIRTIQTERSSPELSSDQLEQHIYELYELADGCNEDDIEKFFWKTIFPLRYDSVYGPTTGLTSCSGVLISQHLVPSNPTSPYRVSQPKPDLLYGYSKKPNMPFTQSQLMAQTILHPQNPDYSIATSQGMRFPFFAIEFKAAGGTRGDIWVAVNQCAGATSACINTIERLNSLLREREHEHDVQLVDNVIYSVAMDNYMAQLYITWKEDLNYVMQQVGFFPLPNPDSFKDFCKQVRNILDWGKGRRLKQVSDALDFVLEEKRKKTAELAKVRPPPSETGRGRGGRGRGRRGRGGWRGRDASSADDQRKLN